MHALHKSRIRCKQSLSRKIKLIAGRDDWRSRATTSAAEARRLRRQAGRVTLYKGGRLKASIRYMYYRMFQEGAESADLLLECHVPCLALPLSSAICCLSLTATRYSVYACVDLCHQSKLIVQLEKILHVYDHGALDWVTLLQMMVIKVGHVWTEGPPGAEGSHWVPQHSENTVWGTGKAGEGAGGYGRE